MSIENEIRAVAVDAAKGVTREAIALQRSKLLELIDEKLAEQDFGASVKVYMKGEDFKDTLRDELSDHLGELHQAIEKQTPTGINAQIAAHTDSAAFDKFLTERIEEVINTKTFKGYLADIVVAEVAEYFKKLPSDYAITLICSALTRLVK